MSGSSEREYLLIVRWSHQFELTRRVDIHRFTLPAETQEVEFERFVAHEAGPQILRFSTRSESPEAVYFLKVHEADLRHEAGEAVELKRMGVPSLPSGVSNKGRSYRDIDLSEEVKES